MCMKTSGGTSTFLLPVQNCCSDLAISRKIISLRLALQCVMWISPTLEQP